MVNTVMDFITSYDKEVGGSNSGRVRPPEKKSGADRL